MKKILLVLVLICGYSAYFENRGLAAERLPRYNDLTGASCPYQPAVLILSGGGIKGAYQVGAIWFLVNRLGCTFDHIYGTSTGAVTAAFLSQAGSPAELKRLVDQLVENYKTTGIPDIIDQRFLGKLRVFLPASLWGVDGINTLDPLARWLSAEIDPKKIRNLTVVSVSLQAGRIVVTVDRDGSVSADPGFWPNDIRDFVLGSSSIPFIVEPRRARLWVHGELEELERDTATIISSEIGLADQDCQIRIEKSWLLPCQYLASFRVPISRFDLLPDISFTRWKTLLRLPTLTESEKQKLAEMISRPHTPQKIPGSAWERIGRVGIELSTLHQLVDGGVTDFIQLEDIEQKWVRKDQIHHAIILTTGELQGELQTTAGETEEFKGAIAVGLSALDYLWDSYQIKTISSALGNAYYRPLLFLAEQWMEQASRWRDEIEKKIGKAELSRIESGLANRFPLPEKRLKAALDNVRRSVSPTIHFFAPKSKIFDGPFDADRGAINAALYLGCSMVANYYSEPPKDRQAPISESDKVRIIPVEEGNPLCRPLLAPARHEEKSPLDFFQELNAWVEETQPTFADLHQLAESGDPIAKARWCAMAVLNPVTREFREEGIDYCKELAEKGDPIGLFVYGQVLEAEDEQEEETEAARLFALAAKKGVTHAMVALGYMYRDGRGVKRDQAEAERLFRQAADMGNPAGLTALGEQYFRLGVVIDKKKAMSWFRKAAARGDEEAIHKMLRLLRLP